MDEIADVDQIAQQDGGQNLDDWAALAEKIDAPYGAKDMPERIKLIETALKTITREQQPSTWAWLQWRLGTSYAKNASGDPDKNIERAIDAFNAALTVYNRTNYPNEWADQQINLSTVYLRRVRGDKVANLRAAIAAAKEAMSWYTSERSPDRWEIASKNLKQAESQLNLENESPGSDGICQKEVWSPALIGAIKDRMAGNGRQYQGLTNGSVDQQSLL